MKIRYGQRIKMHIFNSIRGKLYISLENGASLKIGKFLMITGPLYIKCTENSLVEIGDNCFFNHNCSITSDEYIKIGNRCNIANNVVIVDHNHIITNEEVSGDIISTPVIIQDGVWLGANSVVTKGVHIGKGSVLGAGGVAIKDIPEHEIWGGVPATKIRDI